MICSTTKKYALAFVAVMNLVTQGLASYNCSRLGTSCKNAGMCNATSGRCTCIGSTFAGYDCSQDQQVIMQGTCLISNPCKNGGTCYDMSIPGTTGTPMCYCPYGFYGASCQLPTVFNECFSDQMIVNVNPGHDFIGVVGIQHKTGICDIAPVSGQVEFSLDPVRSQWEGYAAELPFVGAMCGVGPKVNVTGAEVTYTYDVMVRYDTSGTRPEMDELVSFSCTVPNTGGIVSAGQTAVLFSVTDAQGAFVNKPKLGSSITVSFNVDSTSLFKDVMVKTCTVFNSARNMSRPVVNQSCPLPPFGKQLVKQGNKHVLTMVTHAFGSDPTLTFDCSVKVCQAGDTTCQSSPVCPVEGAAGANGILSSNDVLSMLAASSGGSAAPLDFLSSAGTGGTTASSLGDIMNSLNSATNASTFSLAELMAMASGASTGSASSLMTDLLAHNALNDLIFPASGSAAATGPVRKRRDAASLKEEDVHFVRVVGTLWRHQRSIGCYGNGDLFEVTFSATPCICKSCCRLRTGS